MANISFSELMRRNRIKNAWSQAELGEKLGVSQATISTWEIGRVIPDRNQKNRLREILGLDQADAAAGEAPRLSEDHGEEAGPLSAVGSIGRDSNRVFPWRN